MNTTPSPDRRLRGYTDWLPCAREEQHGEHFLRVSEGGEERCPGYPWPTPEPPPLGSFWPRVGSRWRDRHGDVWTMRPDGLMEAPETERFSPSHVEKKWGPMMPVRDETEGNPTRVTFTLSACPECLQAKHGNCDGTTWDTLADAPATCPCAGQRHGKSDDDAGEKLERALAAARESVAALLDSMSAVELAASSLRAALASDDGDKR